MLLFIAACNRHKLPTELLRADSLMEPHPDSALVILTRMPAPTDTYNRWCHKVLYVQARDRLYLPITSYEKIMHGAVAYFDSLNDNIHMQAKSHYYLGRIFQDKGDGVGTAREFLAATPYAEKDKDTLLVSKIKTNLAFILWDNGLLEEADSMYKQVIPIKEKLHDWEGLAIAYCKLGDINIQRRKRNYPLAVRYLLHSLRLTDRFNNGAIKEDILSSLCAVYRLLGKTDLAILYAKRGIEITPDSLISGYCLTIGATYFDSNKYDSATIYLKRSLFTTNVYTKEGAYHVLSKIAESEGRMKDAIRYNELSQLYKDSTTLLKQPTSVESAIKDSFINQSKTKYSLANKNHHVLLLIIGVLFFMACIFFLYRINRKKKLIKETNMLVVKEQNERERQNHLNIGIQNLLNEKIKEENQLMKQLRATQEQLDEQNILKKGIEIRNKLNHLYNFNHHNPDFKKTLCNEDWNEIREFILSISPNFEEKLFNDTDSITNKDLRFCYLIKLGLRYSEISEILGITIAAVYKKKNVVLVRMNKHITENLAKILNEL